MNIMQYLKYEPQVRWRRLLMGLFTCIATTYTASSIAQSLFVIASLEKAGATVPLNMWPSILAHDWVAMTLNSSIYGVDIYYALIIMVGFLVALPSAALVRKLLGWSKWLLYPLAGAVTMGTILYLANMIFYDLPFYAGTRSVAGYCAQLAVGALGGVVFASFMSSSRSASNGQKTSTGSAL